jgi:hypothetical protein
MSAEENKQLVLHWREEAYEKKNLNVIYELHAPDYVGHIVGAPDQSEAARHSSSYSSPTSPLSISMPHRDSSSRRATWWSAATPTASNT